MMIAKVTENENTLQALKTETEANGENVLMASSFYIETSHDVNVNVYRSIKVSIPTSQLKRTFKFNTEMKKN